MGAAESKDKMHCTRYLNGDEPPSLADQVNKGTSSTLKRGLVIEEGNQPDGGQMTMAVQRRSLAGYPKCDTLQMRFVINSGIQTEKHPNPGKEYRGLSTDAFLPLNEEGSEVSKLLDMAFKLKLLFTVVATSSGQGQVTFTDIPLKTSESGGPEGSGYPDPTYLKTVQKILKSKGIRT